MASFRYLLSVIFLVSHVVCEIKNKDWWKNTVFYQVYPWSFMDSNDDGIGDLKGITSKLNHFVDAGIGAIWLSPIYQSPMVDFGYDISDFKAIDDRFGTLSDFKELTKKAKELHIKVVLDLVPNHTSDKHEWFQKSLQNIEPYNYYYMWRTGRTSSSPPNNWISVFSGSAWDYNSQRNLWYFHQFEYRQPDLNYSNPLVVNEMEEVVKFWLEQGVDGFRIDAVPHIFEDDRFLDEPKSNAPGATERDYTYLDHIYTKDDIRTYKLLERMRKILDDWSNERNEDEKVIMTEAYTNLKNTTLFYQYGSHVPFNFKFITDVNVTSKPQEFKTLIETWMKHVPSGQAANWVMGNHDRSRTESRYPGRGDQMIMLAMTLPGVAVTYYGEEIGMVDKTDISWEATYDPQACNAGKDKYQSRSRDPNRTPFQWDDTKNAGFSNGTPWLPVNSNYKVLNLLKEKQEKNSHYKLYQALTSLRKLSPAIKNGTLRMTADDKMLVIFREHKNETITLLINFSDMESQTVNLNSLINFDKMSTVLKIASSNLQGLNWGESWNSTSLTIPRSSSIILVSKPKTTNDTNNGLVTVSSLKLISAVFAILIYTLVN